MFVAVNSVEQRNNPANDDISPADFTALFDSPIMIHNADLELVSCVIRRDISTVVIAGQNSMLVRLGEPETSNQFEAVVPPGSYTIAALADAVADALNAATPIPQYRTWTCTVNANDQLTISHGGVEPRPSENAMILANSPVNNQNMASNPPRIPFTSEPSAFGSATARDQVCQYMSNLVASVPDNPTLITSPVEADGTTMDIATPPQTFYTFDNCALHPNNGECKLTVPLQTGYGGSVIDGHNGTDQDANMYKYYPIAGDPFGAIFGLPNTAAFGSSPPIYFKIKTVASPAGGVTEPQRKEYMIECAPEDVDSGGNIIRKHFAMRINASGVMTIDTTPRDAALQPVGPGVSGQFVRLMANTDYVSGTYTKGDIGVAPATDPLRVGRWDGFEVDGAGRRSYIYTAQKCLLKGWDQEEVPSNPGGSIKYKRGSVGVINNLGSNGQPPGYTLNDFKARGAEYKITKITADQKIAAYILLSPGEGYDDSLPILFDDKVSISRGGKLSQASILSNCAQDTLAPADVSTDFFKLGGSQFYNGFVMKSTKLYGYNAMGICSKKEADDPTSDIGKSGTPDNTDFWVEINPEFQGNPSPFSVTVKQTIKNSTTMNDRTTVTLLDRATPDSWNSIAYTGPNPAPPNWTQFMPGHDIRLVIVQRDMYNIEVKIAHRAPGTPGPFLEEVPLVQTGDIIDGTTVLQTARDSEMPYIPILKLASLQFFHETRVEFDGRFAPVRSTSALVAAGVTDSSWPAVYPMIGPITAAVDVLTGTPVQNYDYPRVCLKTRPVNATQVNDPPAATGEVATVDFDPPSTAQFGGVAGLHSAYFLAGGTTVRKMVANSAPPSMSFVGTFAIEMPNLPLCGYVGKGYDLAGNMVGIGQKLNILHVVPADENIQAGAQIQVFDYKAQYPMPVHVTLDAPTPFQQLQFRLRNIETGALLQDLRHPSQIVFRIIPKESRMESQQKY